MTRSDTIDPREFARFCQEQHPKLVGLLGLFCGSRDLGEEFAQETFMRAYRDWPKVRALDVPAAWLYRVGTNLARSHFRRHRAEARANQRIRGDRPPIQEDSTAVLEVREAVAALPPRVRIAILLRYYGQFRVSEIADVMDCSETTVKKLLRRGLSSLRSEDRVVNGRESADAS